LAKNWEEKAKIALKEGRLDLARQAVAYKLREEKNALAYKQVWLVKQLGSKAAYAVHDEQKFKLGELKRQKVYLEAGQEFSNTDPEIKDVTEKEIDLALLDLQKAFTESEG
jgi:phage shock protein A